MEELHKLKKLWDRSFEQEPEPIDSAELMAIIKKKTLGPVEKLKKSLRLEIGSILVAVPLLIYVLFALPQTYFILNTLALLFLFGPSLIYYFVSLQKLARLWRENQDNLRQSIESTLMLYRFFRKTYIRLNMALFPLGVYFGYVIGFGLGSDGQRVNSWWLSQEWPLHINIIVGVLLVLLLFLVFWSILRLYIRKLYDVHIHKLKSVLDELQENETEEPISKE